MSGYYKTQAAARAYIRAAVTEAIKEELDNIGALGELFAIADRIRLLTEVKKIVDEEYEAAALRLTEYREAHPEDETEAE